MIKYLLINLKIIYVQRVENLLTMVIWRLGKRMSPTGELQLGDKTMFLSKTIAANVCSKEQLEQGVVFCTTKVFNELFGAIEFIENENSKTVS